MLEPRSSRLGIEPIEVRRPASFTSALGANVRLQEPWQIFDYFQEKSIQPETGFNPWDHMSGYEQYARDIVSMRSTQEVNAFKERIGRNIRDRETAGNADWGLLAGFAAEAVNPLNLIPIPMVRGIGFVRAAAKAGAANAAITAVAGGAQMQVDPTLTGEEVVYSASAAALLGGALGGLAGRAGRQTTRAIERMQTQLTIEEQGRFSDAINIRTEEGARAADLREGFEGLPIEYVGKVNKVDELGVRPSEAVITRAEPIPHKIGPDGEHYFYRQDLRRWVADDEAGATNPAVLSDDISEALGTPNVEPRKVLEINEVANKAEFDQGGWKEKYGENAFRDPNEYMTFKGLRALYEDVMVRRNNETPEQFRERAEAAALKEFNASKADASVYSKLGLEPYLDKLNRSPVAKAIRLAAGDNYLTNLPLQIAGDYGWAIRQNALGYRTKPSVFVRSLRHNHRYAMFRQEVDAEWVKFVRGQNAESRVMAGKNVDASLAAAERSKIVQKIKGTDVLDYRTFMEMAGRATFDNSDFQVRGFDVPPEARRAAKAWTKLAKEYERDAYQTGVFYSEQKLREDKAYWQGELMQRKLDWLTVLYGNEARRIADGGGPSIDPITGNPLNAAIKVGDQIFIGRDHGDAIASMIDEMGEDGKIAAANLSPENYGYVSEVGMAADGWDSVDTAPALGEKATPAPSKMSFNQFLSELDKVPEVIWRDIHEFQREVFGDDVRAPNIKFGGLNKTDFGLFTFGDNTIRMEPETFINWLRMGYRYREVYDQLGGEVALEAIGSRAMQTFRHETIHALRFNSFFTNEDWRTLVKASKAGKWKEKFNIEERYRQRYGEAFKSMGPDGIEDMLMEESIAEAFGAWATNPDIRASLKVTKAEETLFQRIVGAIRSLFRLTRTPEFETAAEIFDAIEKGGFVGRKGVPGPVRGGRAVFDAAPEQRFRTLDQLIEDKISTLPSDQRVHSSRLRSRVTALEGKVRNIDDALEWMKQTDRHVFRNEDGQLEPYFPRNFNKGYIIQHREAFTRLITKWYEKTGDPQGARERANSTVHNILNGKTVELDDHIGDPDGSMPKLPGLRHLVSRKLDIPNSFKIVDEELGDISLSDFIDVNILSVAESYTRKMGAKIETARMFGDAGMEKEIERVRNRMTDLGWSGDKQTEYLNHLRMSRDAILGTLRDTDPWRADNRTGRLLGNLATLSMMGRGLLASMVETVRPGMINGWDTHYRTIATRFLSDLDTIKENKELSSLTGEILDFAKDRFNARVAELNSEQDLGKGGTWVERFIEERIPGFFKLNGMTAWTMLQKDIMAFSTQHRIMDEAIKWSEGTLPENRQMALSSIGIGEREALLLAKMPYEKKGRLILPATGNWTGTDGQRAMNYLLDGMAAEMRRGIVTPAWSDRSTLLSGIMTNSRGERVAESDLFRLPFQFMGYGLAANQKVLISGLQGRDMNFYMGALAMTFIGLGINYLKTPTNAWTAKPWTSHWIDAWETGGVGGFFFGDINTQIEHYTGNQYGLRPALGLPPKYGRTGVDAPIDLAGPGVAQFVDIYRAFTDPEFSSTARAQAIRRVIPYNNVLWWAGLSRDTASFAGRNIDLGGR